MKHTLRNLMILMMAVSLSFGLACKEDRPPVFHAGWYVSQRTLGAFVDSRPKVRITRPRPNACMKGMQSADSRNRGNRKFIYKVAKTFRTTD